MVSTQLTQPALKGLSMTNSQLPLAWRRTTSVPCILHIHVTSVGGRSLECPAGVEQSRVARFHHNRHFHSHGRFHCHESYHNLSDGGGTDDGLSRLSHESRSRLVHSHGRIDVASVDSGYYLMVCNQRGSLLACRYLFTLILVGGKPGANCPDVLSHT